MVEEGYLGAIINGIWVFMTSSFKVCVLALLMAFADICSASNEFEDRFKEALPKIQANYQKVAKVKASFLALRTQWGELKTTYDAKQKACGEAELELQSKCFFHVTELMACQKSSKELDRLASELTAIAIRHSEKLALFSRLEDEFRSLHMIPLVNQYAWAIPNDAALEAIQKYGPVVELGAGAGYWAYLLEKQGVDIVAYDDLSWEKAKNHSPLKSWFSALQEGDEKVLTLESNQNRTLLLAWPPKTSFARDAVQLFAGRHLIYIGEHPSRTGSMVPAMATDGFFELLDSQFKRIHEVNLPNWPGFVDKLYVFERTER